MPGKVNPVIPEAVMMVAAQVVGNDATITWANAMGSNFDLNVMMPVIAYNLLQSIDLLITATDHLAGKCIDAERFLAGQKAETVRRIEADPERCQQLVEKSLAMSTALAPRIGYDMAAAIAKASYREGKMIREITSELVGLAPEQVAARLGVPAFAEALKARGGFPSKEEIDRLLDPRAQTVRGAGSEGGTSG
jgi:fumarate hydratase class II